MRAARHMPGGFSCIVRCQRMLIRLSNHHASSMDAAMKPIAYCVPPVPPESGRFDVFMPKKPVTSVGGNKNAVMIDRI